LGHFLTWSETGDFGSALTEALASGADSAPISYSWTDIETGSGLGNGSLAQMNAGFPGIGLKVLLTLACIDTTVKEVPPDLMAAAWDDPAMIARFNAMLDYVFSQIPAVELVALAIGNEVDGLLASPADYAAYGTFFAAAASHARSLRPGLRVGTIGTFGALTGTESSEMAGVNAASDVILATYYPMNSNFTVRPPTDVPADVATLAAAYPGRTIILKEAGFPTGTTCGGSEASQVQFVQQAFAAWDGHATQIEGIYFFLLHDLSPTELAAYAAKQGGSGSPNFLDFVGTLGYRRWSGAGSDKPGLVQLRSEAAARGW
jgi:hypothetical protein